MSDELILHHYDTSPFSEKVRVVLGLKDLPWRSVIIPTIMPKPDLVPLTGGYRRTPVMQIGADIFCDTQVILAEIERRWPMPAMSEGLDWPVNYWADRLFFGVTVPIIFGERGDMVPEAFIKDREQLSGRPFDTAAMKAVSGPMRGQWRAQAAWIDTALARSDGPWLGGATPGIADAAAFMNIWFLEGGAPDVAKALMEGLPKLQTWKSRIRGLGHGARTEMEGAEALAIAKAAIPGAYTRHDPLDPLGVAQGDPVFVMADDYGRDRIAGSLVAANPERIVIAREDPIVGDVHVHFPRSGYMAVPA